VDGDVLVELAVPDAVGFGEAHRRGHLNPGRRPRSTFTGGDTGAQDRLHRLTVRQAS
jgi:hypothetical protein